MKPWFLWVGSMLLTLLVTGCDLDPVVWDGTYQMQFKSRQDSGVVDGGTIDGGVVDSDEE